MGKAIGNKQMAASERLDRPEFEERVTGCCINPDSLTQEAKLRLWNLLPRKWAWKKKVWALYEVGEATQIAGMFARNEANSTVKKRIEEVRERARHLLLELRQLHAVEAASSCLESHAALLSIGSDPPHRLMYAPRGPTVQDGHLLEFWWDVANDMVVACEYAASQVQTPKSHRPNVENARRLVHYAAEAIYRVTGSLPPASKEAWFPAFAKQLGDEFGHSCGTALVDSVLKGMKGSGCFQKVTEPGEPPERIWVSFTPPVQKPPD